ncbi:MAG: DUF2505 domain-containing protein [Deltaproteobacteria bacterium]|nr:MAG: DUF2505 domain-containing protein [Deltaproteobacteria bacterium]
MKLMVRHAFPCSHEVFWQMFWDEDYDRMLREAAEVTRETLWDREEAGGRRWRMRFTPNQELPAMVARAVGTKKLVYEQESFLDQDRVLHWEVFPAVVPDKVQAKGTMKVQAKGVGLERLVDGAINVRIPLIGGRIESAIHQSVIDGYERAYQVSLQWLDQRGLKA